MNPEKKICPICGKEMKYRPITHWTGMRSIALAHNWICSERNRDGAHCVQIEVKTTEKEREE